MILAQLDQLRAAGKGMSKERTVNGGTDQRRNVQWLASAVIGKLCAHTRAHLDVPHPSDHVIVPMALQMCTVVGGMQDDVLEPLSIPGHNY